MDIPAGAVAHLSVPLIAGPEDEELLLVAHRAAIARPLRYMPGLRNLWTLRPWPFASRAAKL